jgi:hypothetical protein
MLVSLDLTNVTTSDVTVDVWVDTDGAGGANRLIADDLVVPAKGVASWRGIAVLDSPGEMIRAQASSADSVHAVGAVLENA